MSDLKESGSVQTLVRRPSSSGRRARPPSRDGAGRRIWKRFSSIEGALVTVCGVGFVEYERLKPVNDPVAAAGGVEHLDHAQLAVNAQLRVKHERNVKYVGEAHPELMSPIQRKCFYLNAYNVMALELTLRKLIEKPRWLGNTSLCQRYSFFMNTKVNIGNQMISLYNVEHKIIRQEFHDPRLHMYLNCGSLSCPQLSATFLTPDNMEEILDHVTSDFINRQGAVEWEECGCKLYVSSIFKWYKSDFAKWGDGVIPFIRKYWAKANWKKSDTFKLSYQPYQWHANSMKNLREYGNLLPKGAAVVNDKKGDAHNDVKEQQHQQHQQHHQTAALTRTSRAATDRTGHTTEEADSRSEEDGQEQSAQQELDYRERAHSNA
jgi:Protein of unknown function, DUF547